MYIYIYINNIYTVNIKRFAHCDSNIYMNKYKEAVYKLFKCFLMHCTYMMYTLHQYNEHI